MRDGGACFAPGLMPSTRIAALISCANIARSRVDESPSALASSSRSPITFWASTSYHDYYWCRRVEMNIYYNAKQSHCAIRLRYRRREFMMPEADADFQPHPQWPRRMTSVKEIFRPRESKCEIIDDEIEPPR